ncbi:MAG: hypothetical protein PHR06_02475 [Candidatus Cloacimonetes bacterium]|nr:hypothetical protein [Candidatus Cloacimonadota bacterium]
MKRFIYLFVIVLVFCFLFSESPASERDERLKCSALEEFYALIEKGIALDFEEMGLEAIVKGFDGDVRQIEVYYLFIKYGAPFTKVEAMENVRIWYHFPEGGRHPDVVKSMKEQGRYYVAESDSTFFKEYKQLIVKALYENLHCGDASVEVTAAASLVFFAEINNDVVSKLEYYANGTDYEKWDLRYTGSKFLSNKSDGAAIGEIKMTAKRALNMVRKRKS